MFSEQIFQVINHRAEELNIEYKSSMNWSERQTRWKIVKAILAMSNTRDGGYIVIGVEEGSKKIFDAKGMTLADFESFNHDNISNVLRNYADPAVQFSVLSDVAEMANKEERMFIVIEVKESDTPVLCKKSEKNSETEEWLPKNVALRENAIYVRSKNPFGSREIAYSYEWRELIDRIVEKNKVDLLRKMPCGMVANVRTASDSTKFDNDQKRDNL